MTRAAIQRAAGFELLTFEEAAAELHSTVTVKALYRARRDGRLWATKIGGRFYTTRQALMEFLQWPDSESPQDCISAKMKNSGSSETGTSRNGQDMALASVERLKQHSLNTSPAANRPPASVLPIRPN